MNKQPYFTYASKEQLIALGVDEKDIDKNIGGYKNSPLQQAPLSDEQRNKLIPAGNYCYQDITPNDETNPLVRKIKVCPFWDMIDNFPEQDNGYCHCLKQGDWQSSGISLLWDQVKECGINKEQYYE